MLPLAALLFLPSLSAQSNVVTVAPPARVSMKKNTTAEVKVSVQLRSGYHVNSHTPTEIYLIPLRLTWTPSPLEVQAVEYPTPAMEKYPFAEKALSVFTGDFAITTKFKVPATAPMGIQMISGKLRYQACSHTECLPPKTIDVKLPVNIGG